MTRFLPVLAILMLVATSCKSDQEKIGALIAHIKANANELTGDYGIYADAQALSRYGGKALPALLKEFETSSSSYRLDIAMALALIPAPERDKVFINYLESQTEKKANEDEAIIASIMIGALSSAKTIQAIPVIQKLAVSTNTQGDIRASAIAALNALGEPPPPLRHMPIRCTTPALEAELKKPEFREGQAALHTMFEQLFLDQIPQPTTDPLVLYQAKASTKKYNSLGNIGSICFLTSDTKKMFGRLNQKKFPTCDFEVANWRTSFSFLSDRDAVVFASRYVDPTEIGYLGRLVKRNSQWLVTEWQYIMYNEDPTAP